MPAINPARLKIQATELVQHFSNPAAFRQELHNLLDFYADRTYRSGQTGKPAPLIARYNVPPPILRQILKELVPQGYEDRRSGLDLCDALWAEPVLEFRQLAARLLGQIQPEPPDEIIERIQHWGVSGCGEQLEKDLVVEGLKRLRQELTGEYLRQVESWLSSEHLAIQQIGLKALLALLDQNHFENLPAIYRMLSPLFRTSQAKIRFDILAVLELLAKRSPRETAVFLKQNLALRTEYPGIPGMVRNSLRFFPSEVQDSLRSSLREAK